MLFHFRFIRHIAAYLCFLGVISTVISPRISLASTTKNAPLVLNDEFITNLSEERTWLDLLHYHDVGLVGDEGSQVDDQDFFLASDGATNSKAEITATILAFHPDSKEKQLNRCRYPARFHWLQSRLPQGYFGETSPCVEFEKWRDALGAQGLTLIFPAAYLNSPSSMFGHTLMRIDSQKRKSELLSYSINYAAKADPNDNELVFSYKGLTGGYPGLFSVLPYYQKVKEYNYLESRDVWEYQLDVTNEELAQFIRHVWEVRDTHFDYYFFTENCSYHLLTLLDAASERFELSKAFSTDVIPADTVRVIDEAGLIKSTEFRPSMLTNLHHQLQHSGPAAQELAITLAEPNDRSIQSRLDESSLSSTQHAQALELGVALSRYRAKGSSDAAYYNKQSVKLLSARSKLGEQNSFPPTPTPEIRDDQGHHSHRWMVRSGHDQVGNYLGVDLRMSYHDFLDPVAGYIPGAKLEIIHLKTKIYADEAHVQIDEFRAIDIASFSPRNNFVKPVSWFVSTGLSRNLYQLDELMPYLTAGPGLTYSLLAAQDASVLLTTLLSNRAYIDNDIEKGYTVESGPKINLSLQSGNISALLCWERHYTLSGARFEHQSAFAGTGFSIAENSSVRLGVHYQEARSEFDVNQYELGGELAYAWYF